MRLVFSPQEVRQVGVRYISIWRQRLALVTAVIGVEAGVRHRTWRRRLVLTIAVVGVKGWCSSQQQLELRLVVITVIGWHSSQ